MDAEKITQILTARLECAAQEIRIYREKMIGTNVCDVMAVTDLLTGYEVKSIVRRFVRFFNLPELSRMFSEVTAFCALEKNGLPTFSDYSDETIPESAAVKDYINELCERTERIRAKQVHPSKDNMLKITTDRNAVETARAEYSDVQAQLAAPLSYRSQIEQCARERDELVNVIRSRLAEE